MNPPRPLPTIAVITRGAPACAAFLLGFSLITGCQAPHHDQPVTIQIQEHAVSAGRFRMPERQRDVWIAPQAVGDEVLQHEQVVTFVEKPAGWRVSSAIEPNTVAKPGLPLETGDYDAESLRRQREILEEARNQVRHLEEELEVVKKRVQEQANQKEDRLREVAAELASAREQLVVANQRIEELNAAESRRQANATPPPPKRGWKIW